MIHFASSVTNVKSHIHRERGHSTARALQFKAGRLGSCSGNWSLGVFWLPVQPQQKRKQLCTSQHDFFFSFFPSENRSTQPSERGSTISYVASRSTFLNLPVLRANREPNDSLLEHNSVKRWFSLHLSLHGIQQ